MTSRTFTFFVASSCLLVLSIQATVGADVQPATPSAPLPGKSRAAPARIMLFITERVEENESVRPYARLTTEEGTDRSWVADGVAQWFSDEIEDEFEIIVSDHHDLLKKIREDDAKLSNEDLSLIKQIAHDHGADYILRGYTHVIGPTPDTDYMPGRTFWSWEATTQMRIYRTDSAKSFQLKGQRAVAPPVENRHTGRVEAARRIAPLLGPRMVETIRKKMAKRAAEGRSVIVRILDCNSQQNLAIRHSLRRVFVDTPVSQEYARGLLTLRFMHGAGGDEIVHRLMVEDFAGFTLDLQKQSDDSIEFRVTPK